MLQFIRYTLFYFVNCLIFLLFIATILNPDLEFTIEYKSESITTPAGTKVVSSSFIYHDSGFCDTLAVLAKAFGTVVVKAGQAAWIPMDEDDLWDHVLKPKRVNQQDADTFNWVEDSEEDGWDPTMAIATNDAQAFVQIPQGEFELDPEFMSWIVEGAGELDEWPTDTWDDPPNVLILLDSIDSSQRAHIEAEEEQEAVIEIGKIGKQLEEVVHSVLEAAETPLAPVLQTTAISLLERPSIFVKNQLDLPMVTFATNSTTHSATATSPFDSAISPTRTLIASPAVVHLQFNEDLAKANDEAPKRRQYRTRPISKLRYWLRVSLIIFIATCIHHLVFAPQQWVEHSSTRSPPRHGGVGGRVSFDTPTSTVVTNMSAINILGETSIYPQQSELLYSAFWSICTPLNHVVDVVLKGLGFCICHDTVEDRRLEYLESVLSGTVSYNAGFSLERCVTHPVVLHSVTGPKGCEGLFFVFEQRQRPLAIEDSIMNECSTISPDNWYDHQYSPSPRAMVTRRAYDLFVHTKSMQANIAIVLDMKKIMFMEIMLNRQSIGFNLFKAGFAITANDKVVVQEQPGEVGFVEDVPETEDARDFD